MRAWPLCLIVIISGCSSTAVELPQWDDLEYSSTEISMPVRLPQRPSESSFTESTVTYNSDGFDRLIAYMDVSDANYDVGVALAKALEAQARAYNHLIDAGRFQHEIAVIRQEQLEQERKDHFIDNLWHRGFIVLIGIGTVL